MDLAKYYEEEAEAFHEKYREEDNPLGYLRFRKIVQMIGDKEGKVLDIGCGEGWF